MTSSKREYWHKSLCHDIPDKGHRIQRRPAGSLEFPGLQEADADEAVYMTHAEDSSGTYCPYAWDIPFVNSQACTVDRSQLTDHRLSLCR